MPVNENLLADFTASLVNLAAELREGHATQQQSKVQQAEQDARDRLTPLEQRLKTLLRDIPESIQAEGLSLPVIQSMLKGRWRGNAHPGDVGRALRHLGFIRDRRWRGDEIGFRALWVKKGGA